MCTRETRLQRIGSRQACCLSVAADRSAKLARRFNHYRQSSRPAKRKIWVRRELTRSGERGGGGGGGRAPLSIFACHDGKSSWKKRCPIGNREENFHRRHCATRLWRRHSATVNNSRGSSTCLCGCGVRDSCLFVICYDISFIISKWDFYNNVSLWTCLNFLE